MGTKVFLGKPPANIESWIRAHAAPATRADTRVWWSSDESNYNDYLIENVLNYETLNAAGLTYGDNISYPVTWYNQPYKIQIGIGSQESPIISIENVFSTCSNLTSITIPDTITNIEQGVFNDSNELLFDTTTIPGIKLIDGWVVGCNNSSLGNLNLTGVKGIANNALGSVGITNVTMSNSIRYIGEYAFTGNNIASITIPDTVISIGTNAFYYCYVLTVTITANGGNANNVKQMLQNAGVVDGSHGTVIWNMPS